MSKLLDLKNKTVWIYIYTIVLGTLGSIIIGYVFYGKDVFRSDKVYFSFLMYGFYGAVFLATLKYINTNISLILLLTFIVLNYFIFSSVLELEILLRDVIFISGLWVSCYVYYIFIYRKDTPVIFRSLAFGAVYGSLNIIFGLILLLLTRLIWDRTNYNVQNALMLYLVLGLLIGIGIGLGFDLADTTKSSIFKNISQNKNPQRKKYKRNRVK